MIRATTPLTARRPSRRALLASGSLSLALALSITSPAAHPAFAAGSGGLDTSFSTGPGTDADAVVNAVLVQGDGKVLVGGEFDQWNGTPARDFVRLNPDGSVDTAFVPDAGIFEKKALALQADGKILVSDWMNLFRLNPDGTRDASFATVGYATADDDIASLAVQPDGKILVGGEFTSWNELPAGGVVRLNPDGNVDKGFVANAGSGVSNDKYIAPFVGAITVLRDGKVVLGGVFNEWNGTRVGRLVRLNRDGTLDRSFTTNTGTGANPEGGSILYAISSIVEQPDGRIVLGGYLSKWNGRAVDGIVRLNPDGTLDRAFAANIGQTSQRSDPQYVQSVALQANGKLLVGGQFKRWRGSKVGNIVRLNANGTIDKSFTLQSGTGATCDPCDGIASVTVQADGKILLGGYLLRWNAIPVGRVIRLMTTG